MAKAGDHFEMPDGSAYIVRRTTADTGGEYVEMEFVLPPGCIPPPPHIHPQQVEEYEILDGSLDITVNGQWRTFGSGDSTSVPRGALHTFRNRSGAVVRVRNWHRPGLRFDDFIERMSTTLQEAGVTSKRDPRLFLCLSKVMLSFDDTVVPGSLFVFRRRDRIPMQALAHVGSLLRLTGS